MRCSGCDDPSGRLAAPDRESVAGKRCIDARGVLRAAKDGCILRSHPPRTATARDPSQRMHPLEHKIPPPVVALIVAAAMWMNSISGPKLDLALEVRVAIAIAIAAVGVAFDLLGFLAFRKARTTINPLKPQNTSALVTTGIYTLSRNPMYMGLVCFLLAWTVFLAALWSLAGPILFVFYINRFQIEPEERQLEQRFGADFRTYKARVRRWL